MHASRVLLSHTAYIHRASHQQTNGYSDYGFYAEEILFYAIIQEIEAFSADSILHESQHLIQEIEQFATGSSPKYALDDFKIALDRGREAMAEKGLLSKKIWSKAIEINENEN